MSSTAVTPGAPAASERHSEFLPTSEKYRMTGEMPQTSVKEEAPAASTEVEEQSPVKDGDASAASDSETAAASEAASTQKEKGPAATKTPNSGESRWAKITRENREMRERLARLESQKTETSKESARDGKQASPPATEDKSKGRAEPQIEDVDEKTGRPKYAALKDYLADHSKWNREEAVREFREMSDKSERERQQKQTEQIIEKTVNERVQAARKSNPDYDEAVANGLAVKDEQGRDAIFYTKGSHLDGFFLDSDQGHEVLYQIYKNVDQHKHIFARDGNGNYLLNPVRQLRELAKIENSLGDKAKAQAAPPAPPVTKAPRPPHQVSGKGTVSKDAVEQAVEDGDSETYMREENARALARLNKKG